MVNQDFIEYIINNPYTDADKIKNGDCIPNDIIKLMSNHDQEDLERCFYKYKQNERGYFLDNIKAEVVCDSCGEMSFVNFFKTKLIRYLTNVDNIEQRDLCLCDKCKEIINKQKSVEQQEKRARDKILREETKIKEIVHKYEYTQKYIQLYLDPNRKWNDDISLQERVKVIMDEYNINHDVIAQHIAAMNYYEWLKTPYWKAISAYKKSESDYQCEVCRNTENLDVHHKDYKRHGYEHTRKVFKQDLICLCHNCHEKVAHKLSTRKI